MLIGNIGFSFLFEVLKAVFVFREGLMSEGRMGEGRMGEGRMKEEESSDSD